MDLLYWLLIQVSLVAKLVRPLILGECRLARNAFWLMTPLNKHISFSGKLFASCRNSICSLNKLVSSLKSTALNLLYNPKLAVRSRKPVFVKWCTLPIGKLKMNLDEESKGNPGFTGCREVIQSHSSCFFSFYLAILLFLVRGSKHIR